MIFSDQSRDSLKSRLKSADDFIGTGRLAESFERAEEKSESLAFRELWVDRREA